MAEVKGIMVPDGTSRPDKKGKINFKRFQIQTDEGIKGSVYIPYTQETPEKLTLLAGAAE